MTNIEKLRELIAEYDANFEKLVDSIGTPEHNGYVRIEQRLNAATSQIKSNLGILAKDPCPKSRPYPCWKCRRKSVCNFGILIMKDRKLMIANRKVV